MENHLIPHLHAGELQSSQGVLLYVTNKLAARLISKQCHLMASKLLRPIQGMACTTATEENNSYESEGVGGRASSQSKKVKYSNNKTPYMDRGK
jgi:hypothetical protein